MKITKEHNQDELTLSVAGRIDTITSKELDTEIASEMGTFNSMVMDLSDLTYISSAGLRILIATQKKLKASNTPFVIKNVNEPVGEILRMSGIDKILTIE
ncbi:MAG: STAS domain-containing protein [Methanobrevibacter thaueri]|uniref:STAS domain-containing protein n=1 Tax=Methanobrevibacter thaueri TaxID=190975 RepID=A0A8T3VG84_9EURY|nr:STAS domain-containing protein [Methanobrevibacter thaueri]MBE6501628.1 STAS domain-containing protein [Methanobrevibacter thaueri]